MLVLPLTVSVSLPPAARNQAAAMNYLDEVPFRTAMSLNGDSEGEITLVTAPDIELPDCTDILMSTMVSSHSGHRWGMLEGMSAVFS